MGVDSSPILIQLLANMPGKATEDGPCSWASVLTGETQTEFLVPGFFFPWAIAVTAAT